MKKEFLINMPQMAIGALSESWFLKELGNFHWDLICDGLNTKSFDLKNDTDDRLYATFVRIKFNCSYNLKSFKENEEAIMEGSIDRFGNSMYFSNISLQTGNASIKGELMTTFSIRNATDNTKLAKSEPDGVKNDITKLPSLPQIGKEYRLLKKKILTDLEANNFHYKIDYALDSIFEVTYELNPYYDLNGVNLLYFAAYPIINDICEAKYFNKVLESSERWEQSYYTAFKDIFYYANCNINDRIIYKLLSSEQIDDHSYKLESVLLRESDGEIIARIFSVKRRNP